MAHKQETTMERIDETSSSYVNMKAEIAERQAIRLPRHSALQKVAKRAMDIGASLMFFLFFGWVYLVIWICVLVTTGSPAIYRHPRVGKGGVEFNCLKFRSMVVDSAEVLDKHLKENPEARAEWEKDFKLRDDPRITNFGKIIRKTSLDELPQFWNVLRGEMSLVGPRPVVQKELKKYYGEAIPFYVSVKPGITGPWQVGGRNDLDYDSRIKLDTEYAKRWTIIGDIVILVKTVIVVVMRKGSY